MDISLRITTSHDLVMVTAFNHRDEVVFEERGNEHTLSLKKGIYTVRAQFSGQLREETVLLHDEPVAVKLELEYFSAAPLTGAQTTHEYYTGPVADLLSLRNGPGQFNSRLLIFLRYSSREHYRKFNPQSDDSLAENPDEPNALGQLAQNLTLLHTDQTRNFVAGSEDWEVETWGGSVGYCESVPEGLYELAYREGGDKDRLLPLYVFDGWQTLVFVTVAERPLFSSTRIMMAAVGEPFNPSDRVWFAVDYTADRLQNNRYVLPDEVRRTLVSEKFINPMLGILFAYATLLGDDRSHDDLLQTVLYNLENNIVPGAEWPDLSVLRLIASRRFETPFVARPFERPPLLRVGMEWLIQAAIDQPDLLPKNSLVCQRSPDLLTDSIWTSWRATPNHLRNERRKVEFQNYSPSVNYSRSLDTLELLPTQEISWAEVSLVQAVEGHIGTGQAVTLQGLSAEIGLPTNAIQTVVNSLSRNEPHCQAVFAKLKEHQPVKSTESDVLQALYSLGGQ